MSRAECPKCEYPLTTCLCEALTPVHCKTRFEILQHPSEIKAAKNTAKLCTLCMPNTTIWVGEAEKDFEHLREKLQGFEGDVCVLYPSENANDISTLKAKPLEDTPYCFLVLDGTWRKAFKLWQLNTWLHELPSIQFSGVESNYHIRKSTQEGGLSTLESVVHCLNTVEPNVDTEPLIKIFHKRQSFFKRVFK